MRERVEVRGTSFSLVQRVKDRMFLFFLYKGAIMIVGIFKGVSYEGKRYY